MKHITTVILLINGLLLSSAVQGQNQQNGTENRKIGAPNTLRNKKPTYTRSNRKNLQKKPLSNTKQGSQQRTARINLRGQIPGGEGEGKGEGKGSKEIDHLKELLGLTDEQALALRAAREEWHILAKSIRDNKDLSEEEKRALHKEGFEEFDAKVREILTVEQYEKLREIRNQHRKPDGKLDPKEIAKALGLTEEQRRKWRAIHEYAAKKIRIKWNSVKVYD